MKYPINPPKNYISSGNTVRNLVHQSNFLLVVLLFVHIPLAIVMQQVPLFATLHAIAVLTIGIFLSLTSARLQRVAYIMAYIVGAEVLWRMTGAQIFWEFGKYSIVLISLLTMLRLRHIGGPPLPLAYFILLLPSIALTISQFSLSAARENISGNLSGPLAVLACSWFSSHLRLTFANISKILLFLIGPIFGIAAIAIESTLSTSSIRFSTTSNFITSGGFGPNQVSAMLGLGALLCFLYVLKASAGGQFRWVFAIAVIVFATQSALTFSRTGLYLGASAAFVAALYLTRDARTRVGLVLMTAIFAIIANYIIVPGLNDYTNGAFAQRFQESNLSSRDALFFADFQVWIENPIIGVGPGGGKSLRAQLAFGQHKPSIDKIAAHTEFSRMLAEHGLFGFVALLILFKMAIHNARRYQNIETKAIVVPLLTWSFLFMLVSAMRVVAPAFFIGLSFALFIVAHGDPNPLNKKQVVSC